MNTKRMTLITLLLISTLTVAGCGILRHGGARHCKPGCEGAMEQPCSQSKNCCKTKEIKPCCEKMKATETPAQ